VVTYAIDERGTPRSRSRDWADVARRNCRATARLVIVAALLSACGSSGKPTSAPTAREVSSDRLPTSQNQPGETSLGSATNDQLAAPTVPRTVAEQGDLSAVSGTAEGLAALDKSLRDRALSALISPEGNPRGSLRAQPSSGRTAFIAATPAPATFISVTSHRSSLVPTCGDRASSGWRTLNVRGVVGCGAPVGPVGMIEWSEAGWTFHAEYQGASEDAIVIFLRTWLHLG